jgi:hypothetical protein
MFNTPFCSPCPWPCQLPYNLAGSLTVIPRIEVSRRPVQRLLDLCVCWVPYPLRPLSTCCSSHNSGGSTPGACALLSKSECRHIGVNSGEEPLVAGQVAGATHLAQQGWASAMARARGTARRKPFLPRQDVGKRCWLQVRTNCEEAVMTTWKTALRSWHTKVRCCTHVGVLMGGSFHSVRPLLGHWHAQVSHGGQRQHTHTQPLTCLQCVIRQEPAPLLVRLEIYNGWASHSPQWWAG